MMSAGRSPLRSGVGMHSRPHGWWRLHRRDEQVTCIRNLHLFRHARLLVSGVVPARAVAWGGVRVRPFRAETAVIVETWVHVLVAERTSWSTNIESALRCRNDGAAVGSTNRRSSTMSWTGVNSGHGVMSMVWSGCSLWPVIALVSVVVGVRVLGGVHGLSGGIILVLRKPNILARGLDLLAVGILRSRSVSIGRFDISSNC